ncbi:MAG: Flp family type IVb pilin [Caenibius sp.]
MTRFLADVRGGTAIEYGLIAALIVIAIVGAMDTFASASSGMWEHVRSEVQRGTTTV